jgi:hypothetical protein
MHTTRIRAAGRVDRYVDASVSLLALTRKARQENLYRITTGKSGIVTERHSTGVRLYYQKRTKYEDLSRRN